MREIFENMSAEGALLIDADNGFNRINRIAALWNMQFVCPILKYTLINFYRVPTRIFVLGNFEIMSREGTTQGCPFAMAAYALALIPLIEQLLPHCKQVWYADDGTGCDSLQSLRNWWYELVKEGPAYGYFPKPSKTWLIVREGLLEKANELFKDSGVQITTEGKRHLGAAIGSSGFKSEYINKKIEGWIDNIERLSKIAITQPHAAFSAFTHGVQSRWAFAIRTVPEASELFKPLEEAIRQKLIPAIIGRDVSDLERRLFSLPARHGGLGISNPCEQCPTQLENSQNLAAPLTSLVLKQEQFFDPTEMLSEQKAIKKKQKKTADEYYKKVIAEIAQKASPNLKRAITLARGKGASSWVTAKPLYSHETILHKSDFRDAM
jgi:hypothetical protein